MAASRLLRRPSDDASDLATGKGRGVHVRIGCARPDGADDLCHLAGCNTLARRPDDLAAVMAPVTDAGEIGTKRPRAPLPMPLTEFFGTSASGAPGMGMVPALCRSSPLGLSRPGEARRLGWGSWGRTEGSSPLAGTAHAPR
jgi:hypothetical protein